MSFYRDMTSFSRPFVLGRRLGKSLTSVLGGSWVVISGIISRLTLIITHLRGLIAKITTTHEPSSRFVGHEGFAVWDFGCTRLGFRAFRAYGVAVFIGV